MLISSFSAALIALTQPTCTVALTAAPAYTHCAQGEVGTAISREQTEADALLAYAESAEPRFARHFPGTLRPYVVLYFEEDAPATELQEAGFPAVLAWASPQKIGRLLGDALRQNARGPENSPLSAETETAVQAQTALLTRGLVDMQDGVIAHEVAHVWYRDTYWRNSGQPGGGYGTPAPDWLDETAAILCENDAMAVKRRSTFLNAWSVLATGDRHAAGAVGDLAHMLGRSHPSHAASSRTTDPAGAQATVTVRPRSGDTNLYYGQIRAFADFLISVTGDDQVFARVTEAFVEGQSIEQWLAGQSAYPQLARDVPGLQSQWSGWIESQLVGG